MQAGTASDIIDFPQPGLLGTFFKQGKVVPVTKLVPETWLKENYKQSWLDMATMTGADGNPAMAGLWQRFNGKSLVWYPKKAFDDAGYKVPTTWEELQALQDMIVSDGDTPWCVGIQSGAATGWPATDWTEDLMLRTTSPENYDKWVKGELKFDSPEVKKAIQTFADIWNNDKMVYGGKAKIVTTFFGDAPAPMFENPPKCWLHRQGNFITSFFPKEAKAGVDYDVFYLPGVDAQYGKPFLVAGDIMAATTERPETCAVMQFFSTGEGVKGWLAAGGALGPQNDVTARLVRRAVGAHDRWAGRGGRHRAVRRLGSDARCGRLWFLLEGHDRLLLRRGRSGHRPEANRRFLAEVVASGWRVERSAPPR